MELGKKIILHWSGPDERGPSPESEIGHNLTSLTHCYLFLISILKRKGKKKCGFWWMGNWRGSERT